LLLVGLLLVGLVLVGCASPTKMIENGTIKLGMFEQNFESETLKLNYITDKVGKHLIGGTHG
jgi:hypothetical protein